MSADVPGWNMADEPGPPPVPTGGSVQRVKVPAVFMIILGILNLLCACLVLLRGLSLQSMDQDTYNRQREQTLKAIFAAFPMPEMEKALREVDTEQEKTQAVSQAVGTGVTLLLVGALMILGGSCMFGLRAYGLAVTSAILTALPCLSCSACCGFGEAVGIWSLVLLFSPDVRAAFR